MLLTDFQLMFLGLILCITGVNGGETRICAFKGSSVDLHCSHQHLTSSRKWFTIDWDGYKYVQSELSVDGQRVTYNMSEEKNTTLTINDLRESDANTYCCMKTTDSPGHCWLNRISLQVVAELQVKVIPATEGQTVTLMCSSSCPLTEKPAAYIWYKNREFLYEDWSPWYQELLSSEDAVTYSCAVKGYEDLRAPEVSVGSITETCFSVTYAKGRMCSYRQTSVDEPCSITYPREVHILRTPGEKAEPVTLTCNTSCNLTDPQTAYMWYRNGQSYSEKKHLIVEYSLNFWNSWGANIFCAVKSNKYLQSAEVCVQDKNCWRVNYVSRRICALEGSSVNITSEYSHPDNMKPEFKCWSKKWRKDKVEVEELIEAAGRVEYQDSMKNQHILTINNLKKNDSGGYTFRFNKDHTRWTQSDLPGVFLIVTELRVKMSRSAVVTEGQRVTLTCSTSCPLTDNTNYIWYLNSRPLTPRENQNKHLILDPVRGEDAGSYSCAVKTNKDISSAPKTLTVQSITGTWTPAAAGVSAALLLLILLTVCWCVRKQRTSAQSTTERSDQIEQLSLGPVNDISTQPKEEDEVHYTLKKMNSAYLCFY
ncbi:carcinoembryonic antigen-related cell adhesion molecule 1-like [Oreochromis aureus]|uniref:carcinoembryonic antigen-related cell adhesion molecule 1-like n=1 Tax=Oreochromis aureus TaxID=47969 RepID=UPI0019536336|nr:carcinoembryonic antigen-related cell adhesion molecule 1-like [Oreochromis aureus]